VSICPKCQRTFDKGTGYCPFDGAQTVDELPPNTPAPVRPRLVIDARAPGRLNEYDKLVGQTLDSRYLIEYRVGEGGMGVVFRARHIVIEKAVAVKVLKREVARDQNVVRRFVQEARAASRIGHPNIIDVTDFGVTPDGMTYQVMEFLDGETLSSLLREVGRVPIARALPIVAQLARALGAAHDKGIIHRDLKPENIFLLSRDGRHDFVKLVDFGIAKVQPMDGGPEVPRMTRVGAVFGTPEYMAPEQAQGRGDIDHRLDIYALGTIFYEMLVGSVPHKGETAMRTLAMQLLEPIRPPRQVAPDLHISDMLETVMMRALAKERDERYLSMQALLEALAAAAYDVPLDQPLSASASPLAGFEPSTLRENQTEGGDDIETLPMEAPPPVSPPFTPDVPMDQLDPPVRKPSWSGTPSLKEEPERWGRSPSPPRPMEPVRDSRQRPRESGPQREQARESGLQRRQPSESGLPEQASESGPQRRPPSESGPQRRQPGESGPPRRQPSESGPQRRQPSESGPQRANEPRPIVDSVAITQRAVIGPRVTERRPTRRRWAVAAALLALTGGVGATAGLLSSRSDRRAGRPAAAASASSAAPVSAASTAPASISSAAPPASATPTATTPSAPAAPPAGDPVADAGAVRSVDPPARERVAALPRSRTRPHRSEPVQPRATVDPLRPADAGPTESLGRGPDIEVQVVTDPRGGRLIHDGIDGGPDGTNFRRPEGTVLRLECRKYDKNQRVAGRGTVFIEFDGRSHVSVCRMRPVNRPKCNAELKNPLDDCPDPE
jgi:serine/threonine protein kinase